MEYWFPKKMPSVFLSFVFSIFNNSDIYYDRIMLDNDEDIAGDDSKMEVASSIAENSSDAASIDNEGRDEGLSVFL